MTEGESQLLAVRLEASLAKFEKQLSRAYGVAKKMSTGMEQRFSDMERKTQKSASASANAIKRELDKRRKGYENLMASMDPVFAATLRFQQGEKKLADALKYGEITTKEHARAMKLLKGQYDAVKTSAMRTGTAVARAGAISRNGRFMIQNAANQVGDMAVQFEMGTNPMRIMGQQLPQLLAGFGAFGAVAGTVAAVLFPLAGYFLKTGEEANKAKDEVKDFADAMDLFATAVADVNEAADLVADLEQLQKMYGDVTDEVIDLTRALARLKEEQAIGATDTAIQKFIEENPFIDRLQEAMSGRDEIAAELRREISAAESQIKAGIAVQSNRKFIEEFKADLADLEDLQDIEFDFGVSADQAQGVVDLFEQFRASAESGDIRAVLVAVDELRERLQGLDNPAAAKLADDFAPVESQLRQAVAALDRLDTALDETGGGAGAAGLRFSELVDKYARDTARLKELAAERDVALAVRDDARADGNDQALADAEAVISAIDEEIARIGDHETRIRELNEQAREMRELLAHIPADEGGEARAAIEALLGSITDAIEEGAKLDGVRLDSLEGQFDGVLGAVDRLLQKLGLARDMFTEFEVPDEWRSVFGVLAGSSDGQTASAALLRQFEGFRSTPYWDVNALRAGYGSDTVTLSDGSVRQIAQGMTVSVEDANRDLARRIVEFQRGIIDEIGMARWSRFNPAQQAALTSVAYNYGSIGVEGAGISSVVRSGSSDKIANAIRALAGHNGGINRDRRLTEAQVFSNGVGIEEAALRQERELVEARRTAETEEKRADDDRQRALKREIKQRERALELRQGLVEAAQRQLSDAKFEATLIGKSASEQARLRAEYMLTQDAKRRGIDLNERLAGQEKTYAELIREQADAIGRVVAAKEEQETQNERLAQQEQQLADLGQSIKDSLLDAIIAGEGFADVLANVAKMLARATLEAALFGSGPFGGDGSGLLGGIFSSLFGLKDGGPVQRLASGGYVTGPGGPRADLVPAMLSNGEYVINAEATKKHRPLLDALNFGMAQKYASGGLVGGGAPSVMMGSSGGINLSVEVHTQSDQPREVGRETADAVRGVMISVFNQQLGQSIRSGGVLDGRFQRKAGV